MDIKKLESFIDSDNIAEKLDQTTLDEIGLKVIEEYDIDLESRADIAKLNKDAMKLAKQTLEVKSFPWEGAANVKYPLITVAGIQFASRSFPELIPDDKIVNIKIIGKDEDGAKEERAMRVSKYMDFQLTEEMDGWLDGMDKMLHVLPITGTCFKKVFYDSLLERPSSKFLTFEDVVINNNAECIKSAKRISHRFYKYENYAIEMGNAGLWLDIKIGSNGKKVEPESEYDDGNEQSIEVQDDSPHLFVEQHRWLDLDEDGYQEPYIVTVHHETKQVFRIVARFDEDGIKFKNGKAIRIEPLQFFVKYPFFPNPSGGFYDIAFGTLLCPINSSINTTINQLLDAGTLAVLGGGFMARGLNLNRGEVKFKPGEWKTTNVMSHDLRAGILPLPVKEPSQVLFSLLGMLISAGKDISSIQDAIAGSKPGENVSAATVTALIEQGLKVFSGIYKRIYRAMTEEFKLLFALNSKYADKTKYIAVIDEQIEEEDFNMSEFNIVPSAEPMFSLDIQRVGKAESVMKISGRAGLDEDAITSQYLKAIKAPDTLLLPPENRPPPPPNPEMEKIKIEQQRIELEIEEAELKKKKIFAEIEKLRADAILQIAKAEAEEEGIQLEGYKTFLQDLNTLKSNKQQEVTEKPQQETLMNPQRPLEQERQPPHPPLPEEEEIMMDNQLPSQGI